MITCNLLIRFYFRVIFNKADTLPKKYASGSLCLDVRIAREETDSAENQSVIGGLNDQDADATWPSYPTHRHQAHLESVQYPDQLKHNTSHQNEVRFHIQSMPFMRLTHIYL